MPLPIIWLGLTLAPIELGFVLETVFELKLAVAVCSIQKSSLNRSMQMFAILIIRKTLYRSEVKLIGLLKKIAIFIL